MTDASRRHPAQLLILDTAERLFAERGVLASSNRQIAEAAGQGNSGVVGYHFGTKADLVRAITRRFTVDVEHRRSAMLAQMDSSAGVREWLGCLLRPWTDYFAGHGITYFARLCAQAMTDSTLKAIVIEEACLSPTLRQTHDALTRCLPAMPDGVVAVRSEIVQQVIVHMCAEREREVAAGGPDPRPSWRYLTLDLIDALTGILTAPCTTRPHLIGLGKRTGVGEMDRHADRWRK